MLPGCLQVAHNCNKQMHAAFQHILMGVCMPGQWKEIKARKTIRQIVQRADQPLENLLIAPVQRIPRYKLLLEALLKHTPSRPDTDAERNVLLRAVAAVGKITSQINDESKATDARKNVIKLQQRFLTPPSAAGKQCLRALVRHLMSRLTLCALP